MIDVYNVTRYDRPLAELEEFWVFSVSVAGKTATTVARLVDDFIWHSGYAGTRPFEIISQMVDDGTVVHNLRRSRLGQYSKLERCLTQSLELDLANGSLESLEAVHGVGPKTSRFFVLHTRPGVRIAALVTHILKFLRSKGYDAPRSTPTGAKYKRLEAAFLSEADALGMDVAELDLKLWTEYSSAAKLSQAAPFPAETATSLLTSA